MEILESGVKLIASAVERAERWRSGRDWNIKLNVGSTWFPSIPWACDSLNASFNDFSRVSYKKKIK